MPDQLSWGCVFCSEPLYALNSKDECIVSFENKTIHTKRDNKNDLYECIHDLSLFILRLRYHSSRPERWSEVAAWTRWCLFDKGRYKPQSAYAYLSSFLIAESRAQQAIGVFQNASLGHEHKIFSSKINQSPLLITTKTCNLSDDLWWWLHCMYISPHISDEDVRWNRYRVSVSMRTRAKRTLRVTYRLVLLHQSCKSYEPAKS